MSNEEMTDALKLCQKLTGTRQVICRPLKSNVPLMENATLTKCEVCGRDCWKLAIEPAPLPFGVTAACTNCALIAGMNRPRGTP